MGGAAAITAPGAKMAGKPSAPVKNLLSQIRQFQALARAPRGKVLARCLIKPWREG
jgi:hypothetical protein